MSLAQGFPNTFSATQQTQEVLKNTDNETKKIYTDINALMSVGGHAHTGNGSDGAPINALQLTGGTLTGVLNEALGTSIASASTINLTTATGNFLHITGTTTITAVTLGAGMRREVIFDGILTLTHHATNNNLPSGANITTAAGDCATYISDGTTVYCTKYQRADGTAVASGSVSVTSGGEILQLRIFNNATTPNTKMDITANNVPLYDASYNQKKSGVISITADLGVSGVNGLDTGTKANSTPYFLYVIGKEDGTIASLWSLSATTPTMPTGYIYKRRVGWNRTDSSGNIYRILQIDKASNYVVTTSTNTSSLPLVASGAVGNVNTPTWISTSVANFIPSTANTFKGIMQQTGPNAAMVAPSNMYGAYSNTTNPPMYTGTPSGALFEFNLETSNIYIASNGSTTTWQCYGWEDSI